MLQEDKEPIAPYELCLGNFIESMGKIEMVTGITKDRENIFIIAHTGWNKEEGFPDDVLYSTYPIDINNEWLNFFKIEKEKIPEYIIYVHQLQNYFVTCLRINLLSTLDWELLPLTA